MNSGTSGLVVWAYRAKTRLVWWFGPIGPRLSWLGPLYTFWCYIEKSIKRAILFSYLLIIHPIRSRSNGSDHAPSFNLIRSTIYIPFYSYFPNPSRRRHFPSSRRGQPQIRTAPPPSSLAGNLAVGMYPPSPLPPLPDHSSSSMVPVADPGSTVAIVSCLGTAAPSPLPSATTIGS